MPDLKTVRDPMGAIEERLGIRPLEELLAERDVLVEKAATLRARHGAFGTWDHERKIKLSVLSALLRAQAVRDKLPKPTEAALAEEAHAAPEYMDFITAATNEKAELFRLESEITNIEHTIQRANALTRFCAAEARL